MSSLQPQVITSIWYHFSLSKFDTITYELNQKNHFNYPNLQLMPCSMQMVLTLLSLVAFPSAQPPQVCFDALAPSLELLSAHSDRNFPSISRCNRHSYLKIWCQDLAHHFCATSVWICLLLGILWLCCCWKWNFFELCVHAHGHYASLRPNLSFVDAVGVSEDLQSWQSSQVYGLSHCNDCYQSSLWAF